MNHIRSGVMAAVALLLVAFFAGSVRADGIALGVVIEDTPKGIVVREVLPSGIADRCMPRLRPGTHIITLNGEPINSANEFKRVVDSSTYVKFQFVDLSGELRWAVAWSGGNSCLCKR